VSRRVLDRVAQLRQAAAEVRPQQLGRLGVVAALERGDDRVVLGGRALDPPLIGRSAATISSLPQHSVRRRWNSSSAAIAAAGLPSAARKLSFASRSDCSLAASNGGERRTATLSSTTAAGNSRFASLIASGAGR
jgi:hypothetical protein